MESFLVIAAWTLGGVILGWFAPYLSLEIMNVSPDTCEYRSSITFMRFFTTPAMAAFFLLTYLELIRV